MAVGKKAPERAVVVPAFGKLLVAARGARQPSAVVARMHALSPLMHGFTRPQLDRYEAGKTPRPDPVALFFLAQLYGADLQSWISALTEERARSLPDEDGVLERRPVKSHRRAG